MRTTLPGLRVGDSRGRFVDGELGLVVLLVEDVDALVARGDLRFELLGELLLLRELVVGELVIRGGIGLDADGELG